MTTAPASASWDALGTTAEVLVTDARILEHALEIVTGELDAIDRSCSRFRPDSELLRLHAAGGRPFAASRLLFEAVSVALRAAEATAGAVDPTIGEALVLAGYDRDFARLAPLLKPVATAVRVRGWRVVRTDPVRRTIAVPRGVRLDLGATAKALAADRAAAAVTRVHPQVGVLVSLGGDIAVAGPAPGAGWTVRVTDDHRAPRDAPGQTVSIRGGGLATSSTTVRRWGGGAHHIIDPATGAPAVTPWRTVSVAAAGCVDANTASTAAIIRGAGAPAWLEELGLPARLVDGHGEVRTVAGWPEDPGAA